MLPLVDLYTFINVEEEVAATMFRMAQEVFLGHSENGASKIGRIYIFNFDQPRGLVVRVSNY
jgi:hypothetical protein